MPGPYPKLIPDYSDPFDTAARAGKILQDSQDRAPRPTMKPNPDNRSVYETWRDERKNKDIDTGRRSIARRKYAYPVSDEAKAIHAEDQ